VGDADVMKCIRMLTFLSLETIEEMEHWEDNRINEKKEILAYELTKLVHGEDEAVKAQQAARALFSGGAAADAPACELTSADFTDGKISILELLIKTQQAPSKGEARRLVDQGGVFVGDEKVGSISVFYTADEINGQLIRKGKKSFKKIIIKD